MKIKELKNDLGRLLISDLEALGLSVEEIESSERVQLYTTTDEYCQEKRESTWVAAVRTDKNKFMMISNGLLYDKPTAKSINKKVEVGRIFVDEPKAEMLLDALIHTYPELLCQKVDDFDPNPGIEEIEEDYETHTIDEKIGLLKKEIVRLEKLRDKTITAESDDCINIYKKIKEFSAKLKSETAEPIAVKRKNTLIFVSSFKENKVVKLVEANIRNIALEGTSNLPSKKLVKTILVDKKLASLLVEKIKETYNSDNDGKC